MNSALARMGRPRKRRLVGKVIHPSPALAAAIVVRAAVLHNACTVYSAPVGLLTSTRSMLFTIFNLSSRSSSWVTRLAPSRHRALGCSRARSRPSACDPIAPFAVLILIKSVGDEAFFSTGYLIPSAFLCVWSEHAASGLHGGSRVGSGQVD